MGSAFHARYHLLAQFIRRKQPGDCRKIVAQVGDHIRNKVLMRLLGEGLHLCLADSQHLAAELSGRFYYDRPPLFSEALHVNTSYTTAVANDYSYDVIYSRLTQAMGRKGDVLIGLSTSGNSKNVIKALEVANQIGMVTVAFTGETGGNMKDVCKYLINIPSKDTPRIQECHMILGHTICELVEMQLFPKP